MEIVLPSVSASRVTKNYVLEFCNKYRGHMTLRVTVLIVNINVSTSHSTCNVGMIAAGVCQPGFCVEGVVRSMLVRPLNGG